MTSMQCSHRRYESNCLALQQHRSPPSPELLNSPKHLHVMPHTMFRPRFLSHEKDVICPHVKTCGGLGSLKDLRLSRLSRGHTQHRQPEPAVLKCASHHHTYTHTHTHTHTHINIRLEGWSSRIRIFCLRLLRFCFRLWLCGMSSLDFDVDAD